MSSNKDIHDKSMGKILFSTILGRQEVSVESLMQRMQNLSQKQDECSETELNYRFKTVEMQASSLLLSFSSEKRNIFKNNKLI